MDNVPELTAEELLYQLEESVQQRIGNNQPIFTATEFKIASSFIQKIRESSHQQHIELQKDLSY